MADSDQWRSRAKTLSSNATVAPSNSNTQAPNTQAPSGLPPLATKPAPSVPGSKQTQQDTPTAWEPLDAQSAFTTATDQARSIPSSRRRMSWIEMVAISIVLVLIVVGLFRLQQRPKQLAELAKKSKPTTASSATNTPSNSGFTERIKPRPTPRETATQIADRVVESAGDGSYSLVPHGEEPIPTIGAPNAAQDASQSNAAPGASTKASSNPSITERPEPPEAPSKSPPSFDPPPPPGTISPIKREALPRNAKAPLRPELSLPPTARAFLSFERIYPITFDKYQTYLTQKKASTDSPDTQTLLRECIEAFTQCLHRPAKEIPTDQRFQIQLTLASLYFDAGRLFESVAFAQQVVAHAPGDLPITTAASGIAFAALQESHLRHYGIQSIPGELHQIIRLCETLTKRSIEQPQKSAMLFSTAQMYGIDGFHLQAAQTYLRIPKQSPFFAKAQLAAGREFWAELSARENHGSDVQLNAIESSAAKYLDKGIESLASTQTVTTTLLAGKLSRAQIAIRRSNPNLAVALLDSPDGVISQVGEQQKMPKDFVTQVHECLFQAHSMIGNLDGIQSALDHLAKQYGRKGRDRILSLQTQVARDFMDQLGPDQSISASTVKQFETALQSVVAPKRKPTVDVLIWAATKWTDLLEHANDPQTAKRCAQNADNLLSQAASHRRISDQQRMTLALKRITVAQLVSNHDQALKLISNLLRDSPTIIDLQFQAAEILTQQARETGNSQLFQQAIAGRDEAAIWGWAKLTNMLAQMRFRADGNDENLERLLKSGYQLNQSRLQQASLLGISFERTQVLESARKHLRQLITTFAQSSPKWKSNLESLLQQVERAIKA